ncbi:response regulator [Celeribacter litoreus]|uniref:response regulator n=1 Tax=Celeribacter litoreus TaxID=2876714 RepID=UPI001CCAC5A6|nr:response regulator [Celeribacter litoreus]MCA0043065.1 response regulator [Celeribacter litoreus]
MRILICHDNIERVTKWQSGFGQRGHEVRRARSVDAALNLLRQDTYQVLIFDLMFGGENGLAVALMAEFHHPNIVSLLMSDRAPEFHQDVFERLSGLRCILGTATAVSDLIAIAESLIERSPSDCRALAETVPQMCETCQIRGACMKEGKTPVFHARVAQVVGLSSIA